MQYDEIVFLRSILANPADATLKLVYADWLQERDDPRAEYVRESVEGRKPSQGEFDPAWVAFMTTLAQPFEPISLRRDGRPRAFTQKIGRRGRVVTFESQFRDAGAWSEGLLADLVFLVGMDWGHRAADPPGYAVLSFLCDLPADIPQTATAVRAALLVADPPDLSIAHPAEVSISPPTGPFDFARNGANIAPWERRLRQHVVDGRRYEVSCPLRDRPTGAEDRPHVVGITAGVSQHGNRFVGALWRKWR